MDPSQGRAEKRPRRHVLQFDRNSTVQDARIQLPVCMHEQEIMESIHSKDVTVIISSTGSGKTTQVPQFLLEDGFGSDTSECKGAIAVTQPRRIAAIACAERIAYELNRRVGELVGYQVRHRNKLSACTRLKFCTDGILLKEIEEDISLAAYSAIVVDEAHERTVNTDLILAFLSKSISLRRRPNSRLGPLKVVIMSATLDTNVFDNDNNGGKSLFQNVGVVRIPSRLHPVTIHFARETPRDYVESAFEKVLKIHRRLPAGGVLVFLSGKDEVERLCMKLTEEFQSGDRCNVSILPLYSMLSDTMQQLIFKAQPDGIRKIIVATNIAETSITVPDIAYVIDSGKFKEKSWDVGAISSSSLPVQWISKSSAEQRSGRAGRTGPGHCYRLYSSAVYDNVFQSSRTPEILRVPAESLVLRLRAMGITHIDQFPFLVKPDPNLMISAERVLSHLGALAVGEKNGARPQPKLIVTPVGMMISKLPVSPRFGRILIAAKGDVTLTRCACRIAAIHSVGPLWNTSSSKFKEKKSEFVHSTSDCLTDLSAICAAESDAKREDNNSRKRMKVFCDKTGLNQKSVVEALAITEQLEKLFFSELPLENHKIAVNNELERRLLKIFFHGFPDQVVRRISPTEARERGIPPGLRQRASLLSDGRICFQDSLSTVARSESSAFLTFVDLVEKNSSAPLNLPSGSTPGDSEHENVLIIKRLSVVDKKWIIDMASSLCRSVVAPDQECRVQFDSQSENITVTCKMFYGQLALGYMQRSVEDLIKSSVDSVTPKVIEKCLDAFSRAILGGHTPTLCGNVLETMTLPKTVVIQRLSTILSSNGAPCSLKSLNQEIGRRGDFVSAKFITWGLLREQPVARRK